MDFFFSTPQNEDDKHDIADICDLICRASLMLQLSPKPTTLTVPSNKQYLYSSLVLLYVKTSLAVRELKAAFYSFYKQTEVRSCIQYTQRQIMLENEHAVLEHAYS